MKRKQIISLFVFIIGIMLIYLTLNDMKPTQDEEIHHITEFRVLGRYYPPWRPRKYDVWTIPTYLINYLILGVFLSSVGFMDLLRSVLSPRNGP